jgi:hypothetical protein
VYGYAAYIPDMSGQHSKRAQRVLAELLDLVDGMIAIAIHEERERTIKAATKAGGEMRSKTTVTL